MRIVGGQYKGRLLLTPKASKVRPTSARVRESIFNVLAHGLTEWAGGLQNASVVDVFCGTGALGLEALSRGARHITLIERSEPVFAMVRKNAAMGIDTAKRITILKMDATKLTSPPRAAKAPCDLAFLDAPYRAGLTLPALSSLKKWGWLTTGSLTVVEIAADEELAVPRGFKALDTRIYGAAKVIFLKVCA